MRHLLTVLVLALVGSDYAPAQQPTPTQSAQSQEQSERERKAKAKVEAEEKKATLKRLDAEIKESQKRLKAQEKERLKRPAQIQINAASDRVGAKLVQVMSEYSFQLVEDSKYRMVFQQEIQGGRAAVMQALQGNSEPPQRTYSFTISEYNGQTTLLVDMSVTSRLAHGKINRIDMNKKKDWRAGIDNVLSTIKHQVESTSEK